LVNLAGFFLRQLIQVSEPVRIFLCEQGVRFFKRQMTVLEQPPSSVPTFARVCGKNPVFIPDRADPQGVSRRGVLADGEHKLRLLAFLGHPKTLDALDGRLVQMQELPQYIDVSFLTADQSDCGGRENRAAKLIRLVGGAGKVLNRLRDSPDTGIA